MHVVQYWHVSGRGGSAVVARTGMHVGCTVAALTWTHAVAPGGSIMPRW